VRNSGWVHLRSCDRCAGKWTLQVKGAVGSSEELHRLRAGVIFIREGSSPAPGELSGRVPKRASPSLRDCSAGGSTMLNRSMCCFLGS
jgi:hypothetical protein